MLFQKSVQNYIKHQSKRFFSNSRSSNNAHLTTIFTCVPGKEFELSEELTRTLSISEKSIQVLKPGILQTPSIDPIPDLIFAAQVLPRAVKFAQISEVTIPAEFTTEQSTMVTHAIVPKLIKGNYTRSANNHRCDNVLKSLVKQFKEEHPTIKFKSPRQLSWVTPGSNLCQLLNMDKSSFFISFSAPTTILHGHWPSMFPAGLNDIHLDLAAAPNSAFRKLQEAFWCFGKFPKPGDNVLDVGGFPGGWAQLCLHYGSNVLSIDKQKLSIKHPHFLQQPGDAFSLNKPFAFEHDEQQVDWLLWDVICEPKKLLQFLERSCQDRWAERMVCNMKFQGEVDWDSVTAVQQLGAATNYDVRAKHFFNNKNEVCFMLQLK